MAEIPQQTQFTFIRGRILIPLHRAQQEEEDLALNQIPENAISKIHEIILALENVRQLDTARLGVYIPRKGC